MGAIGSLGSKIQKGGGTYQVDAVIYGSLLALQPSLVESLDVDGTLARINEGVRLQV